MVATLDMKKKQQRVLLRGRSIGNEFPLLLIAGPCVIENASLVLSIARKLSALAKQKGMLYVFKASYDKANRSSVRSFRGPGLAQGLDILRRVKESIGCPILTDVHGQDEVEAVAQVADIIQIPAFLCRQTDLLLACGNSGRIVNVKKG